MSNWYGLDASDVVAEFESNIEFGLTKSAVDRKRAEFGPNKLIQMPGRGIGRILWQQLSGPLVLLLLAAAGLSVLLSEYVDAVAILAIVGLNAALGFYQDYRAEKAMASLQRLSAPTVRVRREGTVSEIRAQDLVPGDIVLLETGNRVPADGRIMLSVGLEIEEALLTGESEAAVKNPAVLSGEHIALGDMQNMVFMGTVIRAGRGEAIVTEIGMATQLGNISSMLQSIPAEKTPLQRQLAGLALRLSVVAVACVAVVVVLGLIQGAKPATLFMTGLSLSVAIVPEGLPAVATVALALGSMRLLGRHALIRQLPAIETLGSITTICSDKTGTITENVMTLDQMQSLRHHLSLVPIGGAPTESPETVIEHSELALLLLCGALCNDATLSETNGVAVGDPTECAFLVAADRFGGLKKQIELRFPRLAEVAFDSVRKRMTTIHRAPESLADAPALVSSAMECLRGHGAQPHYAFTKGAVGAVLDVCTMCIDDAGATDLTDDHKRQILAIHDKMAAGGQRVLALAFRAIDANPENRAPTDFENGMTFIGLAGLLDPPRPEAAQAVKRCLQAGIRPIMITGDHRLTAEHVGANVGIISADGAVIGEDLEAASSDAMKRIVKSASIYARVSPEHKLRIVDALKASHEIVCMTGDGANDAPALKQADIGVAMGITGTDVARDAADMVLLDDNFATIVNAVEEGRNIYDNIRKFLRYTMTSNAGEVGVMVVAPLLGMPLPLLPLQILWINLVTDGLPGLALALEPPEKDVMQRPPHPPEASILDRKMALDILWIGTLMSAVSLGAGYWFWRGGSGDAYDPSWGTIVFTVLTLSQMGNALATRSRRESLFQLGLMTNWSLLLAVLITFGLQMAVIYVPPLQSIFDTTALSIRDLMFCFTLSTVVFFAVEFNKWRLRRARPINSQ